MKTGNDAETATGVCYEQGPMVPMNLYLSRELTPGQRWGRDTAKDRKGKRETGELARRRKDEQSHY